MARTSTQGGYDADLLCEYFGERVQVHVQVLAGDLDHLIYDVIFNVTVRKQVAAGQLKIIVFILIIHAVLDMSN